MGQEGDSALLSDAGDAHLLKAALIHFYMAYLHPYFDGNGRMARLMNLWYMVQQGYSSALFVPDVYKRQHLHIDILREILRIVGVPEVGQRKTCLLYTSRCV